MRATTPVLILAATAVAIALVGCVEVSPACSGQPGFYRIDGGPGVGGRCVPVPSLDARVADAGTDGGTDGGTDAGPGDAGPCPMGCSGGTPHCGPANTCVACLDDSHCTTAAAARCDTTSGTCAACTASTECAGIAGTEVCEATSGACVECTATEESACGSNTCNVPASTCSTVAPAGLRVCESCTNDRQCPTDHRCVPMQYMGADRMGAYCLKITSTGCAEPFGTLAMNRASISGAAAETYCGINETLATCEATRALLDNQQCPGGMDSQCPQPSGLCRTVGAFMNRCSYPCDLAAQCVSSQMCANGGAGTNYCGG